MRNNSNLTEGDLQSLIATKVKEPGLSVEEIYTAVSRIHPKPKAFFYVLVILWVVSIIPIMLVHSQVWFGLLIFFSILMAVVIMALQGRHDICPIPWYVMMLILGLFLYIVEQFSFLGLGTTIKSIVQKLLTWI